MVVFSNWKREQKFLESTVTEQEEVWARVKQKEITLDQFKETMKGITATIESGTIDESPFAYKNINSIMEAQKESVKIYKHLKPIINWKGTGK